MCVYPMFIFIKKIDKDLDVENQLKLDPTGTLSSFWIEQRRMLNKHQQKRWNPQVIMIMIMMWLYCSILILEYYRQMIFLYKQVLRYCLFMWIRLGNSKFENLREVLTLPSRRTLQIEKSKLPVNGSGFQTDIFIALRKEIEAKAKCSADYDVILSWDATGTPNLHPNPHTNYYHTNPNRLQSRVEV